MNATICVTKNEVNPTKECQQSFLYFVKFVLFVFGSSMRKMWARGLLIHTMFCLKSELINKLCTKFAAVSSVQHIMHCRH